MNCFLRKALNNSSGLPGVIAIILEKQMIEALLVSQERGRLSILEAALLKHGMTISHAESGSAATVKTAGQFFDLIVVDEHLPDMTGLELSRKLVLQNPMSNISVVSGLSHEDFHEASEGLGILMQLPPLPGSDTAGILIAHLNNILKITRHREPID